MDNQNTWMTAARGLRERFTERAAQFDQQDRFVDTNYQDLASAGFFRMAIPEQLGGGGASYETTCRVVHELAKGCAATALAFSMHTHLVAANVWKFRHNKPDAEATLRKIASQNLILVSTGATDWVGSNGVARRVEGGYRVSIRKRFASGSPGAHVLITSAPTEGDAEGPSIVHFGMPLRAEGVKILDDWHTLSMRGSGSHTVVAEDVFVPDAAITARRPVGKWHMVWDLVLGVAPALYMAPYVGLMEAAVEDVFTRCNKLVSSASEVGHLLNKQTLARVIWSDMIRLTNDYAFTPSLDNTNAQLTRKTLLTQAVRGALDQCVALTGGSALYQGALMERLWRDVQGSHFHPLPEARQLTFSGLHALGLDVTSA